jgi:hypothetical protein
MKNAAYLIGISQYPDHTNKGVPNDLTLLTQALQHRNYPPTAINVFNDTHTTLAKLHALFSHIQSEYRDVETGTCYLHIGASGTYAENPLRGGVLPSDGDVLDFRTAFPFAALNEYLPVRSGIRVVVTIDT